MKLASSSHKQYPFFQLCSFSFPIPYETIFIYFFHPKDVFAILFFSGAFIITLFFSVAFIVTAITFFSLPIEAIVIFSFHFTFLLAVFHTQLILPRQLIPCFWNLKGPKGTFLKVSLMALFF